MYKIYHSNSTSPLLHQFHQSILIPCHYLQYIPLYWRSCKERNTKSPSMCCLQAAWWWRWLKGSQHNKKKIDTFFYPFIEEVVEFYSSWKKRMWMSPKSTMEFDMRHRNIIVEYSLNSLFIDCHMDVITNNPANQGTLFPFTCTFICSNIDNCRFLTKIFFGKDDNINPKPLIDHEFNQNNQLS